MTEDRGTEETTDGRAGRRIAGFGEMLRLIGEDKRVNDTSVFRPGFQAMAVYRFGVWREGIAPRALRMPFSFLYRMMYIFVRNVYGIEIPSSAVIGRRLRVAHQHGIIVHPETVMGDDCMIRQGVSIGISRVGRGAGARRVAPILGDRVEVGAGAAVIGAVTVGDDVTIGPNAVVMTDVPDNSMVISPIPRTIPRPAGVTGSERLG
jgi:serine O-acetyltransferase